MAREFKRMKKGRMVLLMVAGITLETSDGRELRFNPGQGHGSPFRVSYLGCSKGYTPGNSWDCRCRIKECRCCNGA